VRGHGAELRSCDVQETEGGGIVTMRCGVAVQKDGHRFAFYLVGRTSSGTSNSLACLRVAENAAALALPQPALASAGTYGPTTATLGLLAEDHLWGLSLTGAGIGPALVTSDAPIDIDWDFRTGVAHVVAAGPTTLHLVVADPTRLRVGGRPIAAGETGSVATVALSQGRHVITGALPGKDVLDGLSNRLRQTLAEGQARRSAQLAVRTEPPRLRNEDARVALDCQVGGPVADMVRLDWPEGVGLAVATGNTIHLLGSQGEARGMLQADGPIRVLRWWPEPELLLAGCTDEKVIAFNAAGRRQWTFTSQMDPAVYEAAKTYWFKSAPGHEGIHGLHTGTFDGGKSRCFVGSACTLEIVDEAGGLVKRTPVFWGPCRGFLLVDGNDGARNLLISRWPNGDDSLAIVDSRSLAVSTTGYDGVPPGHSYVGGWTAQNRTAVYADDLDGDGQPEVATAINGTWNRVTVYSVAGKPLHNAQFGPGGDNLPRSRMRDMVLGDLNGDRKKEIFVGLSEGLVVCLDHDCNRVWSTRLPSPPRSLRWLGSAGPETARIVVGCDDGSVVAMDAVGTAVAIGRVTGRPTFMEILETASGPAIVLATDKGDVQGLILSD
ncbi:MAG: FG-GAP repeat domain-containing protein, partial [Thermoguttaceae bacterium]